MVLLNSCILDPGIRTRRYSVTAHEHDQVTPGPSFNRRDTRILESKWRIRTRRIPPRRRHRKSLGVSSVPLALMTPLRHPSTSFKRAVRFLRFRRSLSLRRLVRPAWLEGDSLDDFRAILSGSRDSGGGPAASSAVAGTTPLDRNLSQTWPGRRAVRAGLASPGIRRRGPLDTDHTRSRFARSSHGPRRSPPPSQSRKKLRRRTNNDKWAFSIFKEKN